MNNDAQEAIERRKSSVWWTVSIKRRGRELAGAATPMWVYDPHGEGSRQANGRVRYSRFDPPPVPGVWLVDVSRMSGLSP